MTGIIILTSTVADGSMYNRKDFFDQTVINNRTTYLKKNNLSINHATRLHPNANERAATPGLVDWCTYTEVGELQQGDGMSDDAIAAADALVTTQKGQPLFLPVADCVGAAFYDPQHGVLMVSHLGRHSLEQQGAIRSVQYLKEHYDANPSELLVWLTPAPNKETFPIWALDNKGMKEVTFEQLTTAGITLEHITDNPADTVTDLNYFSYSEFLKGNRTEDGDYALVAVMT